MKILLIGAAAGGGYYAYSTGALDSLTSGAGGVALVSLLCQSAVPDFVPCSAGILIAVGCGIIKPSPSYHHQPPTHTHTHTHTHTQIPVKHDYAAVRKAIEDVLDVENYDDGSYGPVLVRLAWHASGTYDKATGTGGSNGATMRFAPESEHGANAGLAVAR